MITIERLKQLGFKDLSSDKNGLAYRKKVDKKTELCYNRLEGIFRHQSIGSGFTTPLHYIKTEENLRDFWLFATGEKLV